VWAIGSSFVQTTVVPVLTVTIFGSNEYSLIRIGTASPEPAAEVLVSVGVARSGDVGVPVEGGGDGGVVEQPQHMTTSTSRIAKGIAVLIRIQYRNP
jgi:hypothetical protein